MEEPPGNSKVKRTHISPVMIIIHAGNLKADVIWLDITMLRAVLCSYLILVLVVLLGQTRFQRSSITTCGMSGMLLALGQMILQPLASALTKRCMCSGTLAPLLRESRQCLWRLLSQIVFRCSLLRITCNGLGSTCCRARCYKLSSKYESDA